MPNELTALEKDQLTNGGLCAIHQHEVNLAEHRHIDSLQELEVVVTVTADHLAQYREDIIIADTTLASITITLPKARGGKLFQIVKASAANTLTVNFSNGDTMFGSTSVVLTDLGSSKRLKSISTGYIPL